MTAVREWSALDRGLADLARQFVTWLETGVRPDKLFAEDVFADLSVPHWRVQAQGTDATFQLREDGHPFQGEVRVEALDATSRGFLIQFEERWDADGHRWYCRELIHCAVTGGRISELAISCTGDWDEAVQQRHAEQVRLIRA
ncbi:MAG: hypothetical protein JWN95_2715 [Frankiales bacterium]|nr:hypothetical protein [Frankiales bacterium]